MYASGKGGADDAYTARGGIHPSVSVAGNVMGAQLLTRPGNAPPSFVPSPSINFNPPTSVTAGTHVMFVLFVCLFVCIFTYFSAATRIFCVMQRASRDACQSSDSAWNHMNAFIHGVEYIYSY